MRQGKAHWVKNRTQREDYILKEAVTQEENGAHILDVNVGLPDIDEIFRRFKADRIDFCDIEEICPDIIYLPNNTPDELAIALEIVASEQK